MDGLNINPALNVYFGVGPLGIFLPLFWIIAVGYWSYGAIIGALSETPKIRYNESVEWIVLFFVSILLGFIINGTYLGTGLVLVVIFATLCLYKGVRDLARFLDSEVDIYRP